MFSVLFFNLGTWFTDSPSSVLADQQNIDESDNNIIVGNEDLEVDFEDESSEEEHVEDSAEDHISNEELSNETNETSNTNEEGSNDQEDEVTENTNTELNESQKEDITPAAPEIKTITIPNGTPGSGVATILRENELIDNTRDFIKTAEDLNLANKLKSGSFDISSDATIEDMVRIIARQSIQ